MDDVSRKENRIARVSSIFYTLACPKLVVGPGHQQLWQLMNIIIQYNTVWATTYLLQ